MVLVFLQLTINPPFFIVYSPFQEILYDRSKSSGLLYEKVRYIHRKRRGKKLNVPEMASNIITEDDEDEIQQLIAFFGSCVIADQKSELIDRLKASAGIRKASNDGNREFFEKCFHLYRVDPDLILADFTFMFDVDPNALLEMWPIIEKKPYELYRIQLDRRNAEYHRDGTLHNMLTFIKLFSAHRYSFERSVSSFIIFSNVILLSIDFFVD